MTKKGIMKTFLIIVCVWAWGLFFWFSSVANASDYNKAVTGHVITQVIQGNSVDTSVLSEYKRLLIIFL